MEEKGQWLGSWSKVKVGGLTGLYKTGVGKYSGEWAGIRLGLGE